MKKKLALAFSLYSPYLLWELALIVQVVVYLACSVTLISNFVQQQNVYHSFAKIFSGECIYFQPYDRLVDLVSDPEVDASTKKDFYDKIFQYADQIAPNCEIGMVVNAIGEVNEQLTKVVGYNQSMAKHIGIFESLQKTSFDIDTAIPVLIRGALCDQYEIGDSFSFIVESEEPEAFAAVVVGTLDAHFQVILPSYGASEPTIDSFFDTDIISDDPAENANTIVFCYTGEEEWPEDLMNPACFIFSDKNDISEEKLASQDGKAGGKFFKMKELIQNTIQQNVYANRKPISKVFAASIFTMVSLFGYVFLLFIRNQKLFGVCTLLGMSRRCMFSAIATAVGMCIAISAILYMVFNRFASCIGFYSVTDTSFSVMVYAIAVVFASLLLGALVCSLFIARWQPIRYMKGD